MALRKAIKAGLLTFSARTCTAMPDAVVLTTFVEFPVVHA